jgi:hypothetical protein
MAYFRRTLEYLSISSAFAFRVLLRVEDEAGFLPSESIRLETLNDIDGDHGRRKYFFSTTYHTIYVMGLLCSLALNHLKVPSLKIEVSDPVLEQSNKILRYLVKEKNLEPHWFNEFNKLTELQKEELSGFLLNVALLRGIRQKQYKSVYELLCLSYEIGKADTALASQIAELLERLALLSTFKKGHQYNRNN